VTIIVRVQIDETIFVHREAFNCDNWQVVAGNQRLPGCGSRNGPVSNRVEGRSLPRSSPGLASLERKSGVRSELHCKACSKEVSRIAFRTGVVMASAQAICTVLKRLTGFLLTVALLRISVYAHEGHAPLPTKGTLVDLKEGTVFLTREARDALGVKTAEVDLQPAEKGILAYATLESPWTKHAFATSRVGGRIERLFVKPGEFVKAGQPLAEVRSLELENLQLELLSAENELALSEKIVKQQETLAREHVIPGRNYLEAAAKNAQNQSAVKVARLKLHSLRWSGPDIDQLVHEETGVSTRPLTITSPISGTVTHADLTVGKVIEPNEHLFEIVDLSSVWIRIGVLEKDIQQVAPGQPIQLTLTAYPGESFSGQVQVKAFSLDPQTHLGTVWGELTNPEDGEPKFLPGMYGQARIVVYAPGKKTTVPASAVVGEGGDRFVLVEDEATDKGSQFRRRNIVIDTLTSERAFLSEGNVFPGDRVLTQGAHVLASYFAAGVLRPSEEAKKNIGLRLETVRPQRVDDVIELDGIVDVPPDRRALVSSQLSGTLEQIRVDRGQRVRSGDVIAELASLEFQNLQLEMLQADEQVRLLAQQRKLLEDVGDAKNQIVARRRLWELDSAYTAAVCQRETAQRKLEVVGLQPDQIEAILEKQELLATLPLRAPIDGALVHFDKALGQAIKAEEPLFEIHDLSRAWVQGYLTEREISQVKIGQRARIRLTADPNFLAEGTVVRSGRSLGTDNRTLSVWVELDDLAQSALQHNMLAHLTLTVGQPDESPAVPLGAVEYEGTRPFVFVQKPDGIFERRWIETGRADDRFVEIIGGIEPDELVAVRGTAQLQTAYASLR